MKLLASCAFLLLYHTAVAQHLYPNEFTVSGNRTTVGDGNTANRYGFGAGIYRVFKRDVLLSPLIGIEYNLASQFKTRVNERPMVIATEMTYYIHSLSIPVAMRINLGTEAVIFFDAGGFLDVNLYAEQSGRSKNIYPYSSSRNASGPANLSGLNPGFSFGGGISVPAGNNRLFLKGEYKHGFVNIGFDQTPVYNRYFRLIIGFSI